MSDLGFLAGDSPVVAPMLLGWKLVSTIGDELTAVTITEVEAYRQDDPASHSFPGPTARNATMFGPSGHLYVYRSYGVHWCANVVTGESGSGAGVLLRAGDPVEGRGVIERRRGRTTSLTDGPGKLAQALGIDGSHDGTDLRRGVVRLRPGDDSVRYVTTPRIGISKATDVAWRFVAVE